MPSFRGVYDSNKGQVPHHAIPRRLWALLRAVMRCGHGEKSGTRMRTRWEQRSLVYRHILLIP
jgi:hypothetical protein